MDGVPLVGEMMASRWAFEAALVTQFRDNPYEEIFYEVDKKIADAEYKKLYYVPRLELELSNAFVHYKNRLNPEIAEDIDHSLTVLRNEIKEELSQIGNDKFHHLEKLVVNKFDSSTYEATKLFLANLKKMYTNRFVDGHNEKAKILESYTETEESKNRLDSLRLTYRNDAIVSAVLNNTSQYRVIELDGRLIRKIYPIYFTDHIPGHLFDFRAKFYVPSKHFAGYQIDTFYFNMIIIWLMTTVLFVTLYFDALKNIITRLSSKKSRLGNNKG